MDAVGYFAGEIESAFVDTYVIVTAKGVFVISVYGQCAVSVEDKLSFAEESGFLVFATVCCIGRAVG